MGSIDKHGVLPSWRLIEPALFYIAKTEIKILTLPIHSVKPGFGFALRFFIRLEEHQSSALEPCEQFFLLFGKLFVGQNAFCLEIAQFFNGCKNIDIGGIDFCIRDDTKP